MLHLKDHILFIRYCAFITNRYLHGILQNPVYTSVFIVILSATTNVTHAYWLLATFIFILLIAKINGKLKLLYLLIFILIFYIHFSILEIKNNLILQLDENETTLELLVLRDLELRKFNSETIATSSKFPNINILVKTSKYATFSYGDKLNATCNLSPYSSSAFNALYLISTNTYIICELIRYDILSSSQSLFKEINKSIKEHLLKTFEVDPAGIFIGVTVGDKSYIDNEMNQIYRDSGIYHIFSVSGFHFALFSSMVFLILKPINHRVRIIFTLLIGFIFWGVVGFENIPASRAYLVLLILGIGNILGYKINSIHATSIVLISSVLALPEIILNVSFILTFSLTYSILIFYSKVNFLLNEIQVVKFVKKYIALQTSITIPLIPLSLIFFEGYPLSSLINNIFANLYIIIIYPSLYIVSFINLINNQIGSLLTNSIQQFTYIFIEIISHITLIMRQYTNVYTSIFVYLLMILFIYYASIIHFKKKYKS